jgi:hypothetical protein
MVNVAFCIVKHINRLHCQPTQLCDRVKPNKCVPKSTKHLLSITHSQAENKCRCHGEITYDASNRALADQIRSAIFLSCSG